MTRLTSASKAGGPSASFYYDGLNRQVARTERTGGVTTTTYSLWDGWNLFAEYDSAGSQTNRWSYAGNDLVRRLGAQYGTFYFYPEASGSTRYIADGSGNILERYTYDAYGPPTFMIPLVPSAIPMKRPTESMISLPVSAGIPTSAFMICAIAPTWRASAASSSPTRSAPPATPPTSIATVTIIQRIGVIRVDLAIS